ncbi:coiled-coil domain-containing protein 117-like isoform X2 [Myxocyprinus asiaticus]|uniref:coiled-coil domain-containing protein 117-like isoform X2 n=1 Tax=Myxocyprinus asiaticus TaxID=70543 RepID=UPI0022216BD0|nr:coiled-coil domain-containing protein 117-like isoform X2 [Myxocyprinus asiaticus]
MMQSHRSGSSELEFIMYSPRVHFSNPDLGTINGPKRDSHQLTCGSKPNAWERRCMRKQRRRTNDETFSPKRRKLMGDDGVEIAEYPSPKVSHRWTVNCTTPSPFSDTSRVQSQTEPRTEEMGLPFTASPSPILRVHTEVSGMEVAQRRLQEIEERITLEDDGEEELDVEPASRRPVLVMSDSLREGLQRGIGDILPHTVAQSMSRSCMELVVWRPPEDPLTQRLKDSLQRQQRKQLSVSRQTLTPIPSISSPLSPTSLPQFTATNVQTFSPLFSSPAVLNCGEEDMEL